MKNIKLLFITLLFTIVPITLHTDFVTGTLVKTPHGYQTIEQLTPKDWDVVDKKGKHKNVLPGGRIC